MVWFLLAIASIAVCLLLAFLNVQQKTRKPDAWQEVRLSPNDVVVVFVDTVQMKDSMVVAIEQSLRTDCSRIPSSFFIVTQNFVAVDVSEFTSFPDLDNPVDDGCVFVLNALFDAERLLADRFIIVSRVENENKIHETLRIADSFLGGARIDIILVGSDTASEFTALDNSIRIPHTIADRKLAFSDALASSLSQPHRPHATSSLLKKHPQIASVQPIVLCCDTQEQGWMPIESLGEAVESTRGSMKTAFAVLDSEGRIQLGRDISSTTTTLEEASILRAGRMDPRVVCVLLRHLPSKSEIDFLANVATTGLPLVVVFCDDNQEIRNADLELVKSGVKTDGCKPNAKSLAEVLSFQIEGYR